MRRGWFYVLPTLAIGFVLLECKQPAPLRPQFVYVANFNSKNVSAYKKEPRKPTPLEVG